MKWIIKYMPAGVAMLLMAATLYLLYPYYKFNLQADSVSYLTIARRYASGDVDKAINGYWGPWAPWLVSVLIKGGIAPVLSAIIINSIGAIGFIGISQSLFLKFRLWRYLQWLLNITLAFFLSYAVYNQWFADTWQAFFLLCVVRLFVADQYAKNPALWILTGFFGALAYFARSYSFPFCMVQIICCSFLVARELRPVNMARWIISSFVSLLAMASLSALWIYQLYTKYHIWTFSTAAHLNLSWNIMGRQYWSEEYRYLVPPIYSSSPSWWEDPYLVSEVMIYKGSFLSFIGVRATTVGSNALKIIGSMNALTFFYMLIMLFALGLFLSGKVRAHFSRRLLVVACSFLLFPIGFLLRASQESYLWYLVPLSMVMGGLLIQHILPKIERRGLRYFLVGVFLFSYLCNPILKMKNMFMEGYEDNRLAENVKAKGLSGTFTSNATLESEKATVCRLAYYTRELSYYQPVNDPTNEQLLAEIRRQNVKYFFQFSRPMDAGGYVMKNEQGELIPELNIGVNTKFKVFLVNP